MLVLGQIDQARDAIGQLQFPSIHGLPQFIEQPTFRPPSTPSIATTATTDARFFGLYADIPGLVYGPLSDAIHGFDERVNLESVRHNTQAMALFIAEWCGLEEI